MSLNLKSIYGSLFFIFFFIASPAYAQLQDFELQVNVTDETCSGNGTLSFVVVNTAPGATISFTVYKQPDLANPVSVSSASTLGSLSEGTYTIIATQTLNGSSNSQEAEAVIEKIANPFAFEVSASNQTCVNGAKLIVTVTEGVASLYEIISGPVIIPAQESNVFEGLPSGTYIIRVFDECGDADVTTFSLATSSAPPVITPPVYESNVTGDCDTITVINTLSYGEGIGITYPLTVEYTLTPDNGDPPIVIVQVYESGDALELSMSQTFPRDGTAYSYSIKVTDNCNYVYTSDGMVLSSDLSVTYTPNIILPCGEHYLTIAVGNFTPPFTLNFTTAPADFNAAALNNLHPGPFTEGSVIYGDLETPVPQGMYTVEVIDNCGNTATVDFEIKDEEVEPAASGSNNGCYSLFGRIVVSVPDRKIVSAIIEVAPADYTATHTLPENVTSFITTNGVLILPDMHLGDYEIRIVDECGKEYVVPVNVPSFEEKDFIASSVSTCIVGSGGARITSGNGKLVSLIMTSAPTEFEGDLPIDVSEYIDGNGIFFMDGLPAGDYAFSGTDICGINRIVNVTVVDSGPPANALVFTRNCGNFDLGIQDGGTNTLGDPPTYWLQKLVDVQNNIWGHPVTGIAFTEGTEPSATNSMLLINGQTLTNLEYEGVFRVIKYFESYVSPENIKACSGELGTFEYFDGVTIKAVYNLSCYNAGDIYVDATGMPPLHYTILSKDGVPFNVDNGNNNIFSGLEPAKYVFFVEDACGFAKTGEFDIRTLPDLTNANDPGDMLYCIQPDGPQATEFDLLLQNPDILDNQPAAMYTITYHLTAEDAENGVNSIPTMHTNTSNPQQIFARLVHNHIPLCHDVVSFNLRVSEYPVLEMELDYVLCIDENTKRIYADPGYNSYEWSTGETTRAITVTEAGNYWVKVGNQYDGIICETTADISVVLSGPPETWSLNIQDWTDNENSISVSTTGAGVYEYSIDNVNYQDDPYFGHLETGVYTVYIRDKNGCGMVSQELALLNYPKFFTPNGDGINEKWRLEYSWFEPEALIYIYDRYGKLLSSFTAKDPGWDGKFNERNLPATDYWFVVERKDGKIHKGHFSMIR